MQDQNAETSGNEMPETREDFERMEREMEEAETQLAIQQERAEASGDDSEFLHAQGEGEAGNGEPVEVDFSTLSIEDQISVLFTGLYEMNTRLSEVEQRLILLAQSFVRILEAAGMAEEGTQPQVEVARTMPKMATKIRPR